MKKIFLSSLILLATVLSSGAEFARFQNFAIVLPDAPSAIERAAAAELKEHLSKTFTAPAKLNGQIPPVIKLFIGLSDQAQNSGFTSDYSEARQENKFGIFRCDSNFLLTGFDTAGGSIYTFKDSCGTFLAVEYFAQKYLQTKFFLPGESGVNYAVDPEITFSGDRDIPTASYIVRGFQHTAKDVDRKDFMLFYRRKLGQVPLWSTRNYFYAFIGKWNKRFKAAPEMFSLFGKKRFNASYPYHFPCPSHPRTVPQVVSDITAALKKNPAIYGIRFFCDAPVKNCECEKCVNSPAGRLVTATDRSEFVFAFFCKIANELKKVKPDLIFHLQTKSSHFQPPRTERLPADTVVAVLSGHFESPDYTMLRKRCEQWKNAGAKVVLYSYPRAPEMKTFPIMNPHRIAGHFKNMQGFAMGATMAEGRGQIPYSFSALNTYVHSAVMFDCSVDVDKLIAEFCSLAAPGAATELQAFYQAMEELLKNAGFREDPLLNCYLSFRLKVPRELLDKALNKAPDNAFLQALSRDFSEFEKISKAASAGISSEEEYRQVLAGLNTRQQAVKLSASGVVLDFKPFTVFRDFQKTQVKIFCQGDKLHLQFICNENMMNKLRTSCKENHDGNVWNDDAVEIFIAPPGKPEPCIHLGINALGVYRALLTGPNKSSRNMTDPIINTRAVREKSRWLLNLEIPMSEVRKFAIDNKISLGLYRNRPARGDDKTQTGGVQRPQNGAFNSSDGRFIVEF